MRRSFLKLIPAALAGQILYAQASGNRQVLPLQGAVDSEPPGVRSTPQRDKILKENYERNRKDARDLAALTEKFKVDLEMSDPLVFSIWSKS